VDWVVSHHRIGNSIMPFRWISLSKPCRRSQPGWLRVIFLLKILSTTEKCSMNELAQEWID